MPGENQFLVQHLNFQFNEEMVFNHADVQYGSGNVGADH